MKFWDSSALVPLVIEEPTSGKMEALLLDDPTMLVWYGTVVEIESALNRRSREGGLLTVDERLARDKLAFLEDTWHEVQASEGVRKRALRLLRVHPLRAADALQLAAALVACGEDPQGFSFLTGDDRLREAAEREGFDVRLNVT